MTTKQDNILKEYEIYLKLKNIKSYNRFILEIIEYFKYLDSFNQDYDLVLRNTGDEYRSYLVSRQELSRPTINNKLNRLNNFYGFLLKKNYVIRNPFYNLARLKQGNIIPKNILSVEDMGKFLDNFAVYTDNDLMLKSMVEFLYGSGLRISEVVGLKLNDVDFENGYIYIKESKNNNRKRKTIAGEISLKILKQYLKYCRPKLNMTSEYIYPKKRVNNYVIILNKKLKNECKRLNLPLITTHSFRHSAATHILRSGAGIREVQEFLGHKKISSTQIYTHIVNEDLKNILEKHHPRELEVIREQETID